MKKLLACLVVLLCVGIVGAQDLRTLFSKEYEAYFKFKEEFAKHVTPKVYRDIKYGETLAGGDISVLSYRLLVMDIGAAKSLEASNTRAIPILGLTLQFNRSEKVKKAVQLLLPKLGYGILEKLSLGWFTGYDFDNGSLRYGVYTGITIKVPNQ